MNTSAENLLKIKVNNQNEGKFWDTFFLIMENDELKNFSIFECGACSVCFTFFKLNKFNLKNKINEDHWRVIVLRIFNKVNSIHEKCKHSWISKKENFLNNEMQFFLLYKNVLWKQKKIKKIQIITEDNYHYKKKYIKIEKNNDNLDSLWNKGEYDEVIEKIKDNKDVAIKNLFNLKGDGAIKTFFDKKMKESKFKKDGFIWKEINNIFVSLSKMRNKFFKKTKEKLMMFNIQKKYFLEKNYPKMIKKS